MNLKRGAEAEIVLQKDEYSEKHSLFTWNILKCDF